MQIHIPIHIHIHKHKHIRKHNCKNKHKKHKHKHTKNNTLVHVVGMAVMSYLVISEALVKHHYFYI